ncbi:MAG: sirohydrochlorin cobaltochelatase [Chthoniobacter sp.]|jgi:sirohydrochlorin cobaltochelatase|nr:sirohydrochlorin cobaltochelatase [Chthoniobacter sp.]
MFSKKQSALIIVGHGSTVNPDSSTPTFAHADEIKRRDIFGEVVCAFWKEEPSLRQVLHMIESDDVYAVPNFISEGYFTQKIIPRELELDGPITTRRGRTIKYCEPAGNHARMTELLLHRAAEVAPEIPPAETSLLLIGHGTSLNENSGAAVKEQVRRIAARGEFAEVFGVFMEEEPFVTDWRKIATKRHLIAVPFFVSDGLHSYQDIPVLLGLEAAPTQAASKMEVFRRNPYRVDGREIYYASAIGTEPLFADVILDQVAAFDARHAA